MVNLKMYLYNTRSIPYEGLHMARVQGDNVEIIDKCYNFDSW